MNAQFFRNVEKKAWARQLHHKCFFVKDHNEFKQGLVEYDEAKLKTHKDIRARLTVITAQTLGFMNFVTLDGTKLRTLQGT